MPTAFTLENVEAFLNRSPQLVQDDHNMQILETYLKHQARNNREITVDGMADFIKVNSSHFHWLRDEKEIARAVEAAKPKPEPPKPSPKLKGLTVAEKLAQLGIQASPHLSHADKSSNDQKQKSILAEMSKEQDQIRTQIERRNAIDEARAITIYTAGPNGRIDHGASASARKAALARLGVTE